MSPEGAATMAGFERALAEGRITPDERIVLFNCGHGPKYPMPPSDRALDHTQPVDYAAMAATAQGSGN